MSELWDKVGGWIGARIRTGGKIHASIQYVRKDGQKFYHTRCGIREIVRMTIGNWEENIVGDECFCKKCFKIPKPIHMLGRQTCLK